MSKIDRVGDWDKFAQEMHDYIAKYTTAKYGTKDEGGDETTMDLMTITEPRIGIWNVLKYALRLWNKRGKRYDIFKIVHYAQIAHTKAGGDLKKLGIIGEDKAG